MSRRALTSAMQRELRAIDRTGEPSDPHEWTHAPSGLWFHARDKVLDALLARDLIADLPGGYAVTDAGRAALAKVQS